MTPFTEDIDFEATYTSFLESFPSSRQDFVHKRLQQICFKKIYYNSSGKQIRGYIVMPKEVKQSLPVIIYNRGGNTIQVIDGKKSGITPRELLLTMGYFAEQGFFVIGINYAGGYESDGKDEFGGSDLEDLIYLPHILRQYHEVDSNRVGMLGYSRGGMMTYLCLQSNFPGLKTAATVGGVADLHAWIEERPEIYTQVLQPCFGGDDYGLKKRSAVMHIQDMSPDIPVLICHGLQDKKVNYMQSIQLLQKATDLNLPYRGMFFEHGDHDLRSHVGELFPLLNSWFKKYLQ